MPRLHLAISVLLKPARLAERAYAVPEWLFAGIRFGLQIVDCLNLRCIQSTAIYSHFPDVAREEQSVISLRANQDRSLARSPRHQILAALHLASIEVKPQSPKRLIKDSRCVNPFVCRQALSGRPVVRPTRAKGRRSPLLGRVWSKAKAPLRAPSWSNLGHPRRIRCRLVRFHPCSDRNGSRIVVIDI